MFLSIDCWTNLFIPRSIIIIIVVVIVIIHELVIQSCEDWLIKTSMILEWKLTKLVLSERRKMPEQCHSSRNNWQRRPLITSLKDFYFLFFFLLVLFLISTITTCRGWLNRSEQSMLKISSLVDINRWWWWWWSCWRRRITRTDRNRQQDKQIRQRTIRDETAPGADLFIVTNV